MAGWERQHDVPGRPVYDLSRRQGSSGATLESRQVVLTGLTGTTARRPLAPGLTYGFGVRAHNRAGNASIFADRSPFRVTLVQESSGALVYTGAWESSSQSTASGGAVRSATTAGARASLPFRGRHVGVVVPLRDELGKATLCLDPDTEMRSARPSISVRRRRPDRARSSS